MTWISIGYPWWHRISNHSSSIFSFKRDWSGTAKLKKGQKITKISARVSARTRFNWLTAMKSRRIMTLHNSTSSLGIQSYLLGVLDPGTY